MAHLVSLQLEGNPIRSIRRDIIQCGTNRILKVLRDRSQQEQQQQHDSPKMRKSFDFSGDYEEVFPDR